MAEGKKINDTGVLDVSAVVDETLYPVYDPNRPTSAARSSAQQIANYVKSKVNSDAAHATSETADQAKIASVGKVMELIGSGRRVEPITTWPQTPNTDIIYLVDNRNGSSVITIGTVTIPAGTTAYAYYDGNDWVVSVLGGSVDIVNDLTTGGANKALSAEQGKLLHLAIAGGIDVETLSSADIVNDGYKMGDSNHNLTTGASMSNHGGDMKHTRAIPIEGGAVVTFTTVTYGNFQLFSLFREDETGRLPDNYVTIQRATDDDGYVPGSSQRKKCTRTFIVPDDVKYIVFNCSKTTNSQTSVSDISYFNAEITHPKTEGVQEMVSKLYPSAYNANEDTSVAVVGSSTVWGEGFLTYGYTKALLKGLYSRGGCLVTAEDVSVTGTHSDAFSDPYMSEKTFSQHPVKISGNGASVSFAFFGQQMHICQSILRGSDYGIMSVYADGVKVKEFTNDNKRPQGHTTETFTIGAVGSNEYAVVTLSRCFTYNHVVKVDGVPVACVLNTEHSTGTGRPGSGAEDPVCIVSRASDNDNVKALHRVVFRKGYLQEGNVVSVEYDYGETVSYVKSSIGENGENGNGMVENQNAYTDTDFDPSNPVTAGTVNGGIDFRYTDEDAFVHIIFPDSRKRNILIVIEGGSNPYFIFDFASSAMHRFCNGGIGGRTAKAIVNDTGMRSVESLFKEFMPETFLVCLGGNDDLEKYGTIEDGVGKVYSNQFRKVHHAETLNITELRDKPSVDIAKIVYNTDDDNYDVTFNTGIIDSVTQTTITLDSGSSVIDDNTFETEEGIKEGDYVKIGTYTGDCRQIVCRRVKSFDSNTKMITLDRPITAKEFLGMSDISELVGQEVSVRSLATYKLNMKRLIEKIRYINPTARIILYDSYYTHLWTRSMAEYQLCLYDIAKECRCEVVDGISVVKNYVMNSTKETKTLTADGSAVTNFNFTSNKHKQGLEVIVNGINVYGSHCHYVSGLKYCVAGNKTGSAVQINTLDDKNSADYGKYVRGQGFITYQNDNGKLVWKNGFVPEEGTSITVRYEKVPWSSDFVHPTDDDSFSQTFAKLLLKTMATQ